MENSKIDPARLPELYEAVCQLHTSLELDEVIERTLQAASKLTDAERVFIQFPDRYSLYALPKLAAETERLIGTALEGLVYDVAQNRQSILIANTQNDPHFAAEPLVSLFTSRTLLIAPLQAPDEFLGALVVDRMTSAGTFTVDDLATLAFFAGWVALAIYRNGLYREYISLMTSEFRTPLHMIRGFAEILLTGGFGPLSAKQKQSIGIVYRSAYKMADWIDEYLDIARIENEHLKLEITDVDLQTCISEITAERPLTDLEQALAELEPTLENSPAGIAQRLRAKQQVLTVNVFSLPFVRTDRNRVSAIINGSRWTDRIRY